VLYADAVRHLKATGHWPAALEAERDAICAAGPEGASADELGGAGGGAGGGGGGAHPSDEGVGDPAGREQPAARRLQGPRGLPPDVPPEEEEEEKEEEEEEDGDHAS